MCRYIKDLTTIEKNNEFDEADVSSKIKEIMEKAPEESPSFALSIMVIDAFTEGGSISKVSKQIKISSEIPSDFVPC